MASSLEKRIEKLEKLYLPYEGAVPSTTISRVLLDNRLFEDEGLDPLKATGREATLVWSLSLGTMQYSSSFFYGVSIEETVEKAEKFFAENR